MNLFRLILIFFVFTSQVKANAIYNLIKIPNLEIYEINTKNKLKYFYAKNSFRLGVQKNIVCLKPNEESLNKKYKIINENLNLYTSNFLKKINLKYIVMCENLSISGIGTAGIPDSAMKTLILDIEFNKKYFERVIHHEVFHIINDSHKEYFNQKIWVKFNSKDFKYAKCSTCTDKLGLETYKKTNGFFTEYSQSTVSEDMAEVFSHIIIKNKIKDDLILEKKVNFIKTNLLKIDSSFKF
ncbi:MAG: hypothetical protein EVA75_03300 [Candidatus Pelagibacterales bacterium]|nr:MAG: hypothetical protein EVA75_03300 [Pelagibacterales bacterium]